MAIQEANHFLDRIIRITDLVVIGCNTSFSELEKEKNLPNGAIVKQSLRLAFTSAVKTCIEFRRQSFNHSSNSALVDIQNEVKHLLSKDPVEALVELHINYSNTPVSSKTSLVGAKVYPDFLLQYGDLFRLRALVYRDTVRNDKNKLKPFVIVVIVYYLKLKYQFYLIFYFFFKFSKILI